MRDTLKVLCLCFFVIQGKIFKRDNVPFGKGCILPPHPPSGWWSYVNQPPHFSSGLETPANSMLRIYCDDTYKLDGCPLIGCIDGTWMPKIGRCLKTCPPIYSTSTLNVTCAFKAVETINCTESVEGTLAQFKCASFYEDTRLSQAKAICIGGKWSEKVPECTPVCGKSMRNPTLIVNGGKAKKGEFPWQMALYTVKEKNLICGGSLLSERVVLTAAHCISDDTGSVFPKDDFLVVAGKYYRKFEHPDDQKHIQASQIHMMFVCEKYEGATQNFAGDIAIIITKISFRFSTRIQPVCIDWTKNFENVVFRSRNPEGYVSGWGYTKEDSDPASELKSMKVPSISRDKCKNFLPQDDWAYLTHDKFCAGFSNNGSSVCRGDSGGGLVFKQKGRFFIGGVVSLAPSARGGGCDSQQYSLYTSVYNYTENFILEKLVKFKSSNGDDESCPGCTTITMYTTKPVTKPKPSVTVPPKKFTTVHTTKSPPTKTSGGECILPEHPEFGRWFIPGFNTELFPGNQAQPFTIIQINCTEKHKYDGQNHSVCTNGKWLPKIGKCLKTQETCPSLHNSPKMKITCASNDKNVQCTEAIDGTIAKFKCSKFYEFTNLVSKPSICVKGKWSFIPKCVPACGQVPVYLNSPDKHYPWHVTIYDKKNKAVCDGTIINMKMIITAAHCLTDPEGDLLPEQNYIVAAGKNRQEFNHSKDPNTQFSSIEEIVLPDIYQGETNYHLGDIAIVVVEKPFVPSNVVQPVCIDWAAKEPQSSNKNRLLSGWDFKKPKKYIFDISSPNECRTAASDANLSEYLTGDKFCANFLSNGSLSRHNPGGGLVFKEHDKYYIEGVLSTFLTSHGSHNARKNAMFTRTSLYTDDFILNTEVKYRD